MARRVFEDEAWPRPTPHKVVALAGAFPLTSPRHFITTLGDLRHSITLELIIEIGPPQRRLLSSKLGSKAYRNLGAIQ